MEFADIHIHALYGVDDGPSTAEEMQNMLHTSYEDGVRHLCLTPHSHPGYYGYNYIKAQEKFEELSAYAAQHFPDLRLYLGSELRFAEQGQDWLEQGICRSLNGTDHVLVDFDCVEERGRIVKGLRRMLNAGYKPVLAHAERYLHLDMRSVRELKADGAIIQLDAQSLACVGSAAGLRAWRMVVSRLADVVSSDSHSYSKRGVLTPAYRRVRFFMGKKYTDKLFLDNPLKLLQGGDR